MVALVIFLIAVVVSAKFRNFIASAIALMFFVLTMFLVRLAPADGPRLLGEGLQLALVGIAVVGVGTLLKFSPALLLALEEYLEQRADSQRRARQRELDAAWTALALKKQRQQEKSREWLEQREKERRLAELKANLARLRKKS